MYSPRSYQHDFLKAFWPILNNWDAAPIKRGILVWHRRAGKDLTALNFCERAMMTRSGTYFHFLPTYAQAKKIIWSGQDRTGKPFLDYFNRDMFALDPNHTELRITYRPTDRAPFGSTYQLIGGDNIDSIVGTNPVGCIFSEYPLMNPKAWQLMSPILRENGGWALFIFTPRGKNHAFDLWEQTKDNPRWYRSLLGVNDTERDADGEPGGAVVTPADIDEERSGSGISEEMIQQEYYCSFEGAMEGAYYAHQMATADKDGRIGTVPYDPEFPVDTAWDLGVDDETAIWFTQQVAPNRLHVIDYMAAAGNGLDWYVRELQRKPYQYNRHYAPHDIKVKEWGTGNTRLQTAARLGIHFEPQPKLSLEDGIEACRQLLPLCFFDKEQCEDGIDALKSYRREKDEKLGTFKNTPLHDWSSHGADAFRTRAVAWRTSMAASPESWAATRYFLHRKHVADGVADEADMVERVSRSHFNDTTAPNELGTTEIDRGDDWWKI